MSGRVDCVPALLLNRVLPFFFWPRPAISPHDVSLKRHAKSLCPECDVLRSGTSRCLAGKSKQVNLFAQASDAKSGSAGATGSGIAFAFLRRFFSFCLYCCPMGRQLKGAHSPGHKCDRIVNGFCWPGNDQPGMPFFCFPLVQLIAMWRYLPCVPIA